MGLARPAGPLLWLGGLLVACAVAAGNLPLLGLGLIPVGLAVAGALGPHARVVEARLVQDPERAVVGQDVVVTAHLRLAGRGPLQARIDLPETYRLVQGRNVLHTWVHGRGEATVRFTAACDRRGVHTLGPVRFEAPAAWLLGAPVLGTAPATAAVRVEPPTSRLRRWPEARTRARRPRSDMDVMPTGLLTTQFQDIRQYVRGDPHRSINWKASARRATTGDAMQLWVNDYEREGRRQVWVFLDARPDAIGTNLDNAFERRIEAAFAIASVHLKRGFAVGFSIYNQDYAGTPYADQSGRQMQRILTLLAELPGPATQAASLGDAIKAVRGRLHRSRTVAYVVTTLQGNEETELRLLRRMLARRRGPLPALVVHVDPVALLPEARRNDLARTLALLQRPHLEAVRALGLRVVRWSPGMQGLPNLVRRLGA